jgi:hypothetical protein
MTAARDGRLTQPQEEDSLMAAKKRSKPRKVRKAKKPERVISVVKAGKVVISKYKLAAFMKELEKKGIDDPKVQFVARNAPFMRRPPV